MHHEVQGQGAPVVLMAGLGGLGAFWKPVMERLSRTHQCITFDHPGMGRSPPAAQHSIAHIAAQVLALDHAERVERIVLSATWARPDRRFRDLFQTRRVVLERAGFAAYNAVAKLLAYPPDWYEAHLASAAPMRFDDQGHTDGLATALARIDMLLTFDRAEELAGIRAPTLIIGASDDAIVPISHSHDLARRLPQARLIEMQGGHFLPQTQTARYVDELQVFLGARP